MPRNHRLSPVCNENAGFLRNITRQIPTGALGMPEIHCRLWVFVREESTELLSRAALHQRSRRIRARRSTMRRSPLLASHMPFQTQTWLDPVRSQHPRTRPANRRSLAREVSRSPSEAVYSEMVVFPAIFLRVCITIPFNTSRCGA